MSRFELVEEILSELPSDEFGYVAMDFLTDYRYYGHEVNCHILQLNFDGSSDYCYMMAIPEADLKGFKAVLDQYPVYFIDFECGEIRLEGRNLRAFLQKIDPDCPRLSELSLNCICQPMPKLTPLTDEMIKFYVDNPSHGEMNIRQY